MPFGIEADADFHHRQAAQGETLGILLQVYLTQGCIGILPQFQFDVRTSTST